MAGITEHHSGDVPFPAVGTEVFVITTAPVNIHKTVVETGLDGRRTLPMDFKGEYFVIVKTPETELMVDLWKKHNEYLGDRIRELRTAVQTLENLIIKMKNIP